MQTSSPASRVQSNLQELFKSKLSSGSAYIKFQLTSEITALLSLKQVQESLIVKAENITTLPNMPRSLIGMMNKRDRVFCIFDLAQLLSLASKLFAPQYYQVLILQTIDENPIYVGLAVTCFQGIVRISQEKIQSSKDITSSSMTPFISGVISEKGELLPVLDFERILEVLDAEY